MESLWLPLTLLCAFALATSDALAKRALASHNEYLVLWLRLLFALPLLFAALPFVTVPPLSRDFFTASLMALPLEALAALLYVRALRLSPLSLTLPFLALTPVFLLVIPYLLLGERITPVGGAGIILVAAGSYVLNLNEGGKGLLAPLRAIRHEPGSLCMIGVALIYSVTSTLGKKAVTASAPLFFSLCYLPALTLLLTPVALWGGRRELKSMAKSGILRAAALPGLLYGVMFLSHMTAVSLTNVAYMIAVKRTSLLMGVLYGHLLFREPGIRHRLPGALLMVAGVALIATGW
ncbi:EamA family transporter [Geobacter sp.]|uniref:EamA family transporter n=1 Tax=Geobacter sp. TaxID=46610 RepID=UPI0027B8FC86|nr:EamA family transporter [Geobacter sp.]